MTRIQVVKQEVKKLNRVSLAVFRNWFRKYDATAWDHQIEKDVRTGKLAKFAREALKAHQAGKTRAL
jgi:transposase